MLRPNPDGGVKKSPRLIVVAKDRPFEKSRRFAKIVLRRLNLRFDGEGLHLAQQFLSPKLFHIVRPSRARPRQERETAESPAGMPHEFATTVDVHGIHDETA